MSKTSLGSLRYITAVEFREALEESHRVGYCTNELIDIFTILVRKLGAQANFRNYSYLEDLIQAGIAQCAVKWDKFDLTRQHPHAYFSQCAYNAFRHLLNIEKKQRDVKQALQRELGVDVMGYENTDSEGGELD